MAGIISGNSGGVATPLVTTQSADWMKDVNGDLVYVLQKSDGTVEYLDAPGGAVIVPVLPLSPNAASTTGLVVELYRLDGNVVGTSGILVNGVGAVGNTVTITAPYKAISPLILRETTQDPGDGSIATTTVNGLQYNMGIGNDYATILAALGTSSGENYTQDMTISVTGNSFIELWVTREV